MQGSGVKQGCVSMKWKPTGCITSWEYGESQLYALIVNNKNCTHEYNVVWPVNGFRVLSPPTWHRLGITWNTGSSFGLPLCKKNTKKSELIQWGTPTKQRAVVLDLREEAEGAGLVQASKRGSQRHPTARERQERRAKLFLLMADG